MNRLLHIYLYTLLIGVSIYACTSQEPEDVKQTYIHGQITVDATLDTTLNYSGIRLLIEVPTLEAGVTDTLFDVETDREGFYAGTVEFRQRNIYSMSISRNGQDLAYAELVLADGDSIRFDGELPGIDSSAVIESYENDLYSDFRRLNTGVNRLYQFIDAGLVTGDTLVSELNKWSGLFWDFYNENPETFAGEQAALSAAGLLEGLNNELMMERLDLMVEQNRRFIPFASRLGTRYMAHEYNLDRALTYMDSLSGYEMDEASRMQLDMDRILIQYDSARVETAKSGFERFKVDYADNREAQLWIEQFEYDLTDLAPGSSLPEFQFVTLDGDTLTNSSMRGKAYILELTRLDHPMYDLQFDRSIALYHIYNNYGVEIVTVPLMASQIMVDAFFEERARLWHVARPGSFNRNELRDRYNINTVPTRILVDQQGMVVRKYEGTEYNDIINGLRQVINSTNTTEEPL